MNVNPRQNDPQFQSPTQGDSERASQFGMGSQADVPGQAAANTQGQPVVPNPNLAVGPSSIVPGTQVYGSDGQKVGAVEEVYDDSFLVQKGIFFVRDYYIPLQYVAGVSNDRVDLSLTSDEAKSQNWANRPGGTAQGAGQATQTPTAYGVYGPQGPEDTIQAATQRGEEGVNLGPGMPTTPGIGQRAGTMPFERPLVPTAGAGPEDTGSGASASDYGQQTTAGSTPARGSSQVPGTTPTDSAPEYGNMRQGRTSDANASGEPTTPSTVGTAPDTQDTGTQRGTATPLQDQVPTSGVYGRAGEADTLQSATNRGLQGVRGSDQDELTGPPEPTSPDQWTPERQGADNP